MFFNDIPRGASDGRGFFVSYWGREEALSDEERQDCSIPEQLVEVPASC